MNGAAIALFGLCLSLVAWPVAAFAALGAVAPQPASEIELDTRFMAGEQNAPVVLVLYACGRSERCSTLVPSLYYEVMSGRLKGKVRLYYRPFFPDDQPEATACGRALVAAASQGEFWPYLLYLYYHREAFQLCLVRKWADLKGLDGCAFDLAYNDPKTTEFLAAAKREALRNKVDVIPTAFINGRKVTVSLTTDVLIELLKDEIERVSR